MKPLTDQELEIMKIIWSQGQVTVRAVYEALLKRRRVAYTTVMTMMKILEQKGHLTKIAKDGEKAYLYNPTKPKDQVIGGMVKEFIQRVFNGSAEPLLLHLVEQQNLSDKEKKEIETLLDQKRRNKR